MPLHQNTLPALKSQQGWQHAYAAYLGEYFNSDLIQIVTTTQSEEANEYKSDFIDCDWGNKKNNPEIHRLILPNELTHSPEIQESGLVTDSDYLEENVEAYRFERFSDLIKSLQIAILRKKLNDINVQSPEDINAKIKAHFIQRMFELVDVIEKANWEGRQFTYGLITDHFIKIADKMQQNIMIDFDFVEASSRQLHVRIFNAPEYSQNVRVALYGALGALAGFALGMLIFGVISAVTGGIAGIPAAIKLATDGYVLGTSIALGVAAGAGASYKGATSWRKQEKLSRWNASYYDTLIGGSTFERIDNIHQGMIEDQRDLEGFIPALLKIEVTPPEEEQFIFENREEEQFTFEKPEADEYSLKP